MDEARKADLIKSLNHFKERLTGNVFSAYAGRGANYGRQRFESWRRQFGEFLDTHMPGERAKLDALFTQLTSRRGRRESDADVFWREDGDPAKAYLDGLIDDINNGELDARIRANDATQKNSKGANMSNRIFIVHGHDVLLKTEVARFVERLGFEAVILHEKANEGHVIIEKLEKHTDVGFAVVLYTPDDKGNASAEAEKGNLNPRARQNVVFEHGLLVGKLGRGRVATLVTGSGLELPSDIQGVVYMSNVNWQLDLAKEMKAAGYVVDFNKLL